LKAKALRRLEIRFAEPVAREEISSLPNVRDVVVEDGLLTCNAVGSIDALIKAAARHEVISVISHEADLEDLFLRYYEGDDHAA
jgi:ABC-2 type transport system ATP-binding protein